jgi:hypothetical protein
VNRLTINRKLIIPLAALIAIAVTLTVVTAAVLSAQQNIPSAGSIQGAGSPQTSGGTTGGQQQNSITSTLNLAVYTDAAATINCTNINWGILNPGDTTTKTIFIKNTGSTQTTLSLAASSWSPASASSVLTLTWNKEGATLAAGETIPATLTLQVAQDTGDLSSFSLNIVVSGSAQ